MEWLSQLYGVLLVKHQWCVSVKQNKERRTMKLLEKGQKVFIRTITHYYTGKVAEVDGQFILLEDAAWIADTGRWSKCLATGEMSEVEPFPNEVLVSLAAIVDIAPWNHALPRDTK